MSNKLIIENKNTKFRTPLNVCSFKEVHRYTPTSTSVKYLQNILNTI